MNAAHWLLVLHTYAGGIATVPNLTKDDCAALQQRYTPPSTPGFILTDDGNLCPIAGGLCTKQSPQFTGGVRMSECIDLSEDGTKTPIPNLQERVGSDAEKSQPHQ